MVGVSRVQQFDGIPAAIRRLPAGALHDALGGPTLFHLPGRDPRPLFLSCLLHGNEPTGWQALIQLLDSYAQRALPRSMSVLVGNVEAAAQGLRALPGQADFNRIWPNAAGQPADASAEAAMMAEVVQLMRSRGVVASIDIHNNTGENPHYGCLNALDPHAVALAGAFSAIALYFTYPTGVQTMAFLGHCPGITIECGKPGWQAGIDHATAFLETCLRHDFDTPPVNAPQPVVYQTAATVRFPGDRSFGFGEASAADFVLNADIEQMNWRSLPAGTEIGRFRSAQAQGPVVLDLHGQDTGGRWLKRAGERLVTTTLLTPAMLTRDPAVIRADCLCYLLERMQTEQVAA